MFEDVGNVAAAKRRVDGHNDSSPTLELKTTAVHWMLSDSCDIVDVTASES